MICFHILFTLPWAINLVFLLAVTSKKQFQITVNTLEAEAWRTMGRGHILAEAQLVFLNQALGLVSSRWILSGLEKRKGRFTNVRVWVSSGHPGWEHIPASPHPALFAQCSLPQSLLIRGGFSPPSLTQGGWGESVTGDPLAHSAFIRGDFRLGNGVCDHFPGCLRRSLCHVGFRCTGHRMLRTAFHSWRDQNSLHFQSGWRPNLALQGWQLW